MNDCCCPPAAPISAAACPSCRTKGIPVELQTVKALLVPAALSRLNVTHHRFCAESTCEVVYFDDAGGTFSRGDVRARVWQKEPFGERVICYCFAESEATIRFELNSTGASHVVSRVRAHINARRCACDIRNPKGSCCLGDLLAAVKAVESSILERNAK